jgi:hypothetical protein
VREEVADTVGKVSAAMEKGKTHFRVGGEIFSHGGTLAIHLESFAELSPPAK